MVSGAAIIAGKLATPTVKIKPNYFKFTVQPDFPDNFFNLARYCMNYKINPGYMHAGAPRLNL